MTPQVAPMPAQIFFIFFLRQGFGFVMSLSLLLLPPAAAKRPHVVPAIVLVASCFYSSSRLVCSIDGAVVTSHRCVRIE